jgi:PAS domain S-box-containing protein
VSRQPAARKTIILNDEPLRGAFGATPECLCIVGQNGLILNINRAGLRLFEAPLESDMVGRAMTDFIAPPFRAAWQAHHANACAGREDCCEFETSSSLGRRRLQSHAAPLPLAGGDAAQLSLIRPVAALAAGEELQQAILQLRERDEALDSTVQLLTTTEQSFSLLVESVTDLAIFMLDPSGRVVSWNSGARRIKGYEAEEIVGEHFARFYTAEDQASGKPMAGLQTAAREGRIETEGWRVRKDGSRFWANVIIDAIRSKGQLLGFAKITRDITERRAAEAQLRHAQKMEAVGQFTGGAAHDFNNLLMAILGSLEILRKRLPPDPKLLALLDNAVQAGKRGSSLTQRMLAFARRQELKQETIEVCTLVRDMAGLLERSVGARVRLNLDLPAAPIFVLSDAAQLQSAILNLVMNSNDAMPLGGAITLAVSESSLAAKQPSGLLPGRYARIDVRDTGAGMDAATLARATEPFFTTKGVGKGTGLGLSMADGVAGQSGGRLVVHSTAGRGTTVELWLPVAADLAEPRARPLSGASDPEARNSSDTPRRLRILVVDDDELVLDNTAAMLEDLNHDVLRAATPFIALDILDSRSDIDLVLTDQAMPVMTGIQLIEVIRKHAPHMPVILATGYAELSAPVDPAVQRLAKPYTQRDLAEALRGLKS